MRVGVRVALAGALARRPPMIWAFAGRDTSRGRPSPRRARAAARGTFCHSREGCGARRAAGGGSTGFVVEPTQCASRHAGTHVVVRAPGGRAGARPLYHDGGAVDGAVPRDEAAPSTASQEGRTGRTVPVSLQGDKRCQGAPRSRWSCASDSEPRWTRSTMGNRWHHCQRFRRSRNRCARRTTGNGWRPQWGLPRARIG